jgi:dolichol-phosphate mannosyltransferase
MESKRPPPQLFITMPVFNEEASIKKVVLEWFAELENWTEDFCFYVIDDGSTDKSLAILHQLRDRLGDRLEVVTHTNQGHGQSCLKGYRTAIERNIPFIFQIDSDGQCDPQYFFRFWRDREKYDVIYGVRIKRDDGWRRVVASKILRISLLLLFRANCVDANVPYRLMRTESCAPTIHKIPAQIFLSNVAIAVLIRHQPAIKQGQVNIRFRERYGGEPSVPFSKFAFRAKELVAQLRALMP